MRRRDVLRTAGGALLGYVARIPALEAVTARAARRVRPTDPAWPSRPDWASLGRRVHGNLLEPVPLLANCVAVPAGAACAAALGHLRNPFYVGDQAGGTQVSGWLDAWQPAASRYAVACRTPADAVAAVNFGRERNLRLVVKGGGHSYQGTSNASDSLLIWTRAMHAIQLRDGFVGRDCEGHYAPVPAVTVESGAVWMDVYDAVTTQAGRYVQGGGCATVGVAGLVQSGGFGSFSKRYGSAASSLLEAEIVTADGQLRVVNARRDPELFWALRGGGGGSWGVITKLTLRTHELPPYLGAAWGEIKASSDAAFRRLVGRFVEFYAASLFNPHWGESVAIRPGNVLKLSMVSQDLDSDAARAVWKPFWEFVAATPADYTVTDELGAGSRPARDWWDVQGRRKRGSTSVVFDDRPQAPPTHAWWSGDQDQVSAFIYAYDSAWLPSALLEPAARERLADALCAGSRHSGIELHFNKGLGGAPPEARDAALATATNPAVVDAFALAIVATGGRPRYAGLPGPAPDEAGVRREADGVRRAMEPLLALAPTPGSYVSESDYFNARWQDAFFGSHYARLADVKRRYDPDGLFFVHHGVGSEEWSADGFTRVLT
jgi:FAD/FMN-containing dehydrogenase